MRRITFLFLLFSVAAAAQVTDNFSDGDFTAGPAWSGDNAEFIVNASQQLQVNNTVAGASYLSTASPASSINNTEWRFWIRQSFAPSGSNYGRVYLASDQANLEGALNGYYLQFGEAGSLDAVELFRQSGLTSTSVARGINGEIAAAFTAGIKVTRDTSGNWSLYVDPAGGISYGLEATGLDNTFTTTAFFGVASVYTISSATKFYFDDFYNGAIVVDTTAPAIVSSSVISATQLDVLFNENVDAVSSQLASNYSADNGLGIPSSAVRDASNHSLVHLTWATSFTNGLLNTLTITGVQDLSANAITTATTSFTYFAPVVAAYRDVIINEIFADPTPQVALPTVEFAELFNRSTTTLNLNGWIFTDGTSTATLSSYNLSPGQYLILCSITDTAMFSPFGPTMGVTSFPSLNNAGDNLKLKNSALTIIDSVDFLDTWYQDGVKQAGGWSLELINPNASPGCPVSANWIASADASGGTPGIQNSVYSSVADVISPSIAAVSVIDSLHVNICFSEAVDASQIGLTANYSISGGIGNPVSDTVNSTLTCLQLVLATPLTNATTYTLSVSNMADCSGNVLTPATATFSYYLPHQFDVLINEIMADPDPAVNLPPYEYTEFFNRTTFAISLDGWTYTAGTTTRPFPPVSIPADSFLVITSATALPAFPAGINIVAMTSYPGLTNTGETLTIRDKHGAVIHTVSYTDAWYQDPAKVDGGWSLELIDPANPCTGEGNWRASVNSNGGTPGTQNSVFAANADLTPPLVVRAAVVTVDTVQVFFNESLDSTTMLNPSIYSIDNGIGAPISVLAIAPDFKSVKLALPTSLLNNVIYTVLVNNVVTDCAGNTLGSRNTARFAIPQAAGPQDVVINEILYDPNAGGVDFVEIYNRSQKVVDLKSFFISQYDTVMNAIVNAEIMTSDGYLLFPGDYLVLSENGAAVKSQYHTDNPEAFLDIANLPSMSTTAGTICLSTSTDIIDNFKYYADMQFPLLNVTKGVTLERIDFDRLTQDRTNWHSAAEAVGFGTPGYRNSQYNEAGEAADAIEIVPEVFSPDEDGYNDIVSINYHFDTPGFVANVTVFDSKGRIVRDLVRNELLGVKGTFSWDGINNDHEKERIGIYIFYIEVFDLSGTVKKFKKTCVLGAKL